MLRILGTTGFIGKQDTIRPLSENNSGAIGGGGVGQTSTVQSTFPSTVLWSHMGAGLLCSQALQKGMCSVGILIHGQNTAASVC